MKKLSLILMCVAVIVVWVTVSRSLGAMASPWAEHNGASTAQTTSTLFAFGRTGGNIRPFTITIATNGQVTKLGPGMSTTGSLRLSQAALKGLLKLVKAEKFSSLPNQIEGNHVLPDVASLYITVATAGGTKTVRDHGAHNASFDQLFAVLMAVAGTSM